MPGEMPDLPMTLLRDGEGFLQRARRGIEDGAKPMEVAMDLRQAGEALIAASDEIALAVHARRKAAER